MQRRSWCDGFIKFRSVLFSEQTTTTAVTSLMTCPCCHLCKLAEPQPSSIVYRLGAGLQHTEEEEISAIPTPAERLEKENRSQYGTSGKNV